MAVQDRDVLPARRPPHPDGAVGARRGDPLPVRAVHGRRRPRRDVGRKPARPPGPLRRPTGAPSRPPRSSRGAAPSGRNAALTTLLSCPRHVAISVAGGRVPEPRRRSSPEEARRVPSGLNASPPMSPRWPKQVAVCLPEVASNTASRPHSPSDKKHASRAPSGLTATKRAQLALPDVHATEDPSRSRPSRSNSVSPIHAVKRSPRRVCARLDSMHACQVRSAPWCRSPPSKSMSRRPSPVNITTRSRSGP